MASELQIATKLVRAALAAGYSVSVNDGEAWPVSKSHDEAEILAALQSTDSDTLRLRSPLGDFVGNVLLIWGNGEDVISDHTDNKATRAVVAKAS